MRSGSHKQQPDPQAEQQAEQCRPVPGGQGSPALQAGRRTSASLQTTLSPGIALRSPGSSQGGASGPGQRRRSSSKAMQRQHVPAHNWVANTHCAWQEQARAAASSPSIQRCSSQKQGTQKPEAHGPDSKRPRTILKLKRPFKLTVQAPAAAQRKRTREELPQQKPAEPCSSAQDTEAVEPSDKADATAMQAAPLAKQSKPAPSRATSRRRLTRNAEAAPDEVPAKQQIAQSVAQLDALPHADGCLPRWLQDDAAIDDMDIDVDIFDPALQQDIAAAAGSDPLVAADAPDSQPARASREAMKAADGTNSTHSMRAPQRPCTFAPKPGSRQATAQAKQQVAAAARRVHACVALVERLAVMHLQALGLRSEYIVGQLQAAANKSGDDDIIEAVLWSHMPADVRMSYRRLPTCCQVRSTLLSLSS